MNRLFFSKPGFAAPRFNALSAILLSAIIFILSFGAVAFRISQTPDIFTDEIIYTRAGIRVAGEGALVWDSGEPFLVHPPLYFLVEGAYFALTGNPNIPLYNAGDIFTSVWHARYLNAFLAGITALVLFWLGRRLYGTSLGLLLVGLFILDPFGVRTNRRAMLETLAGLLSVSGMAVFLAAAQEAPRRRALVTPRVILAGLLLGAALLAKELTFISLLAVLIFGAWELWRNKFRLFSLTPLKALAAVGIAGLTYGIYPLWVLTTGQWSTYAAEKYLELERMLGVVQITGWNRPGLSLAEMLYQRLVDYGTSYFLFALGGAATLGLLLWGRQRRAGRLLASWGLVLYPFFAFLALAGSGNDQFFYYLLVPAITLVGYAAVTFPEGIQWLAELPKTPSTLKGLIPWVENYRSVIRLAAVGLLVVSIVPFNMIHWITRDALGQDNGYAKFTAFIQKNLPPGEAINASGDPIKFWYFLPDYSIYSAATPDEAMANGLHYFALAPKDVLYHYGTIQPSLAAWIQANGQKLFSTSDPSYGEIYLYRVNYANDVLPAPIDRSGTGAHWRSFHPAISGFVGSLIAMLLFWGGIWSSLAIFLGQLQRKPGMEGETIAAFDSLDEHRGNSLQQENAPTQSSLAKMGLRIRKRPTYPETEDGGQQ